MKVMRRFVVLALILLVLVALKVNSADDEYAQVETFRGAQLEESVFYPLIAKNINDGGGLELSMDGENITSEADELYLNENLEVMASLEFLRSVLYTNAQCYDKYRIVLERNEDVYEFEVGETAGTINGQEVTLDVAPVAYGDSFYLPLRQLCEYFGYDYNWNTKKSKLTLTSSDDTRVYLPKSYDLRDKLRVSEIKDQGNTKTCWAYAAIGALESDLLPEEHPNLSAEDLIENRPYHYANDNGGDFAMALAYLLSWNGPVTAENGCTVKHVQEAHFYDADDIDDIKWGVYLYGGVSTSIYANVAADSLGASDYYNSATDAYCYRGTNEPNHDVVIIGWDDDYSAKKFSDSVPGDGAFICQNSWGADFGDNGVFYVSYYDANIGNQAVSYVKIEDTDNYDTLYQMDQGGWMGQIGYGKTGAWVAAVYTAEDDETLKAAGIYALDKKTSYQMYAVSNYTSEKSLAVRKLVAAGTIEEAGYYTIPFLEEVKVQKGEDFAIIMFLNTQKSDHPIAIEYKRDNVLPDEIDITDGRSFVSKNGLDWESVEETAKGNLCLKVYANHQKTEE